MAVQIGGKRFWLWRAVDSEGEVLDLLVQPRRDKAAAVKLMRKLLKKQGYAPTVLVTDKLRSYGAARKAIGMTPDTSRVFAQTTGPKTRISLSGGGSGRCRGSSQADQPSASCPPILPSITPSTFSLI